MRLCDQCQEIEVEGSNVHNLYIHIRSFRVSIERVWAFCSPACRDAWWIDATDEDFHPVIASSDLLPVITLPTGSDLYVYVGKARDIASPQILTLRMLSSTTFDVSSSRHVHPVGVGELVTITRENEEDPDHPFEETSAVVEPVRSDVPELRLYVRTVPLQNGDTITIDYKGNTVPQLLDDDGDESKLDRNVSLEVYRQQPFEIPACVEQVAFNRPLTVNEWWKTPPGQAELPLSQRTAITPVE